MVYLYKKAPSYILNIGDNLVSVFLTEADVTLWLVVISTAMTKIQRR